MVCGGFSIGQACERNQGTASFPSADPPTREAANIPREEFGWPLRGAWRSALGKDAVPWFRAARFLRVTTLSRKSLLTLPTTSLTFLPRSSRQRNVESSRTNLPHLAGARAFSSRLHPKYYPDFMAGHHQWFTVQRLKGISDPKRGRLLRHLEKDTAPAAHADGGEPGPDAFAQCNLFEIAARTMRLIAVPADGEDVQDVPVNFDAPGGALFTRIAV